MAGRGRLCWGPVIPVVTGLAGLFVYVEKLVGNSLEWIYADEEKGDV